MSDGHGPRIQPIPCLCGCEAIFAYSARCCSYVGPDRTERTDADLDLANHLGSVHRVRMPLAADEPAVPEPAEQPDLFAAPSPVEQGT